MASTTSGTTRRPQHSASGSAFYWGAILGGAAALLDLVDRLFLGGLELLGPQVAYLLRRRHAIVVRPVLAPRLLLVEGLVLLVVLLLFFLAGAFAARRADAIEAGIGAGAVAGGIVAIVHLLVVVVGILIATTPPAVLSVVARGVEVAALAFAVAIAASALGALLGRGPGEAPAPTTLNYSSASSPESSRIPEPFTPTPHHYGPENDYPTAPLQSPLD